MLWLERIPVESRDAFDEWLTSDPVPEKPLDPDQAELLEIFGLRRPR